MKKFELHYFKNLGAYLFIFVRYLLLLFMAKCAGLNHA
jgi:hypothetical protein